MSSPSSGAVPQPSWVVRGSPAYRRISLALFLAGFATFSLLYCVQPLLPAFVAHFGVTPAASALSLSLTTGCLAVAIVLAGALSEGLGRRGLMFVSMLLAALCNLAASLAPGWEALLAARALEGLLLGGVPAVAMAYLSEEIEPAGLGFAMGLYVGGSALGGMLGRVAMGAMTEYIDWHWALAALSLVNLLAAIGFYLLLPPSRNFQRKTGLGAAYHLRAWGAHLAQPGLLCLFLIAFGLMGVFVSIYNYLGFLLAGEPYALSPLQVSHVFYAYLFGVVASPVAGALADRFGRAPVLLGGVAFMALGLLLTLGAALASIVAGIMLMTMGFFTAHSVASGWVGRLATQSKGHASSLYLLGYYLGSSLLGAGGGWFMQHTGWAGLVASMLVLLAGVFLLGVRVRGLARQGRPAV
ncbi:MFS transporter [Comamonas endophytica]|uniref:MFS transporter n=1 Tax=Comamonas endophytica TaxID=2949090 RepID=A0ABY6GD53_9BURK|nr:MULTISPECIES: MFS transporter [unclassified Acidovorax]MCD2512802.1 MFS transporter [Acidovorax sp. D4N7]UYG52848.1 MFS transporter [Acidovorax sp. 5MLIR]